MKKLPLTFNEEALGPLFLLKCPVCGFYYTQPTRVAVSPIEGKTRCEIDASGVTLTKVMPVGRGIIIAMDFQCEEGHAWETTFTFHKGTTSVKTRIKEVSPYEPVIWRD